MSTLEIMGLAVAGLVLLALFLALAMLRDDGACTTTIPEGIGTIDEPR